MKKVKKIIPTDQPVASDTLKMTQTNNFIDDHITQRMRKAFPKWINELFLSSLTD